MKAMPLFLFACLFWLVSCETSIGTAEKHLSTTACREAGTVLPGSLENTSRGYPYHFNVYLPPCYERETKQQYPVLYLLPGSGGGPYDWFAAGAGEAADQLIRRGEIPPLIIVATESIDSDRYGEVIFNDLIAYVDDQYRSQSQRKYRAVAGASLGGIGAYRLLLRHPDLFASAGLFGSGLIAGEEEEVRQWLTDVPTDQRLRVFIICGQQDPLMLAQAEAFISILDGAGIQSTAVVSPGAHNYAYWVSNLPAYLRWLVEDW
jgi:enterochelin esterase-like enzyme